MTSSELLVARNTAAAAGNTFAANQFDARYRAARAAEAQAKADLFAALLDSRS